MTRPLSTPELLTPIYLKSTSTPTFPSVEDPVYYVLTGDGLFIGRNTQIGRSRFHSIVPAPRAPGELAAQAPRLVLDYPRLSAALLARVFGFFYRIARDHGAEAMVLLALNERGDDVEVIVPDQVGTVSRSWSGVSYPIDLKYEWAPAPGAGSKFAPTIIGDIHSHAFESAYASALDQRDETHAPGLHLVAGHMHRDPPSLHADFVVDGTRFSVPPGQVVDLEGYDARDPDPPAEWLERVTVERLGRSSWSASTTTDTANGAGGTWDDRDRERERDSQWDQPRDGDRRWEEPGR